MVVSVWGSSVPSVRRSASEHCEGQRVVAHFHVQMPEVARIYR
jgi:hypothetical protein